MTPTSPRQRQPAPMTEKVTYLVQEARVGHSPVEHAAAVRGMLGACIQGALEHFGRADHARTGTTHVSEVRLCDIDRVLLRNDKGIHGHGFEWAVHSVVNGMPGIPEHLTRRVQQDLAAHAGAVLEQLGVRWLHLGEGLRSVMYGVERRSRGEVGDRGVLDAGALLWAQRGEDPFLLRDLIPKLGPSGFSRKFSSARSTELVVEPQNPLERLRQTDVPRSVSYLWRADLLLGGIVLDPTPYLLDLTAGAAPTAWLSATLKYPAGRLEGGAGLHLGIDTNYRYGRSPADRPEHPWRDDGLRHVQLRVEDDFLSVFNAAWRLLRTAAAEGFPRHAHPTKFEQTYASIIGELGRRRHELAASLAADLLHGSPIARIVSTAEPRTAVRSLHGGRRAPLLVPVPATMGFAA
jgi:hypothetical protein